jgi:hypothetical protein
MKSQARSDDGSGLARFAKHVLHPHSHSHADSAQKPLKVTCSGCGTTSEVEIDHGRDADLGSHGYFERPCPHCGQEPGVMTSRRMI